MAVGAPRWSLTVPGQLRGRARLFAFAGPAQAQSPAEELASLATHVDAALARLDGVMCPARRQTTAALTRDPAGSAVARWPARCGRRPDGEYLLAGLWACTEQPDSHGHAGSSEDTAHERAGDGGAISRSGPRPGSILARRSG